jgi:hypothetical protein
MSHFARQQPRTGWKAGKGVTPQKNPGGPVSFRGRGARRDGRRDIDHSVVAGLTAINAYESTDPDNAFSDGLTSPRE